MEAVNTFMACILIEPNEKSRNLLQGKINEFIARCNELEETKLAAATSSPSPASKYQNLLETEMSKGDFILEQALLADEAGKSAEAMDLYLNAVDAYLIAKTALSAYPDQVAIIGKRILGVIERAEAIKSILMSMMLPDAPVGVLPNATVPAGKKKSLALPPPTPVVPLPTLIPTATSSSRTSSMLSKAELDVLRRSSVINNKMYLPWNDVDYNEKFVYPSRFTDPDGMLPLSREQVSKCEGW